MCGHSIPGLTMLWPTNVLRIIDRCGNRKQPFHSPQTKHSTGLFSNKDNNSTEYMMEAINGKDRVKPKYIHTYVCRNLFAVKYSNTNDKQNI